MHVIFQFSSAPLAPRLLIKKMENLSKIGSATVKIAVPNATYISVNVEFLTLYILFAYRIA